MERRSFLKLAIGAVVVIASGMELLVPKKELEIANDHETHFKVHMESLMNNLNEITREVWFQRERAEWMKLASAV